MEHFQASPRWSSSPALCSPSNSMSPAATPNSNTSSLRRTRRKITTLSKFKGSMDALMRTLTGCDLHYVRCLKPNRATTAGKNWKRDISQENIAW